VPQARKSTRSSSRRGTSFKEPAALKRLNKSINDAEKALRELRAHASRGAATNTQGLYKGLSKFLTDARRDSGKFATALRKDFDKAMKAAQSARGGAASSRSRSSSTASSRSGGGRSSTSSRSRSGGGRSTTKRSSSSRRTRKSS
jgi:hypothetical protein